jgi:hypothetical protein
MMAARMAYAAISVAVAVWWWWRVAIRKATDDRWGSRQIFYFVILQKMLTTVKKCTCHTFVVSLSFNSQQ